MFPNMSSCALMPRKRAAATKPRITPRPLSLLPEGILEQAVGLGLIAIAALLRMLCPTTAMRSSTFVLAAASLVLSTSAFVSGCSAPQPASQAAPSPAVPSSPPPTSTPEPAPTPSRRLAFEQSIRPILAARCTPCHFPGGIMYARLPFDDPHVLASHSEGALRRLKGDDRAVFENWIASLSGSELDPKTKK